MTSDIMRGPIYAGIGGFLMGVGLTTAFMVTARFKTAGPKLSIFPTGGLIFASAAVIGSVADEALKLIGWTNHTHSRLIVAHVISAVVLSAAAVALIGFPFSTGFKITSGVLLALSALSVNAVVKCVL